MSAVTAPGPLRLGALFTAAGAAGRTLTSPYRTYGFPHRAEPVELVLAPPEGGADIGVPSRECEGEVRIALASTPDEQDAVAIELDSSRLTLAGLVMTNAKALLVSGDSTGETGDGGKGTAPPL